MYELLQLLHWFPDIPVLFSATGFLLSEKTKSSPTLELFQLIGDYINNNLESEVAGKEDPLITRISDLQTMYQKVEQGIQEEERIRLSTEAKDYFSTMISKYKKHSVSSAFVRYLNYDSKALQDCLQQVNLQLLKKCFWTTKQLNNPFGWVEEE